MIFQHFLLPVNEANAFLLGCEHTHEALLVDAGSFNPPIAEFLEEHDLRLTTVFITHDHYDHTAGLAEALNRYQPEVLAGSSHVAGFSVTRVRHGDDVRVGKLAAKVLAVPGHTPDSITLAFPGMVFTGDALFAGSVGGTGSNALAQEQIDHIRRHIFTLPADTEIHTGHGPSSTVAIESRFNPFFV